MITIHRDVEQGSDSWHELRRGILTCSELDLILTPKLKVAANEKTRLHLYELLAQRVSGYVEPQFVSDAMLAGHEGEIIARELYAERFAPVEEVGFITNDDYGFTLGYSPDGLVGDDGAIEIKSPRQKQHMKAVIEWLETDQAPEGHMLQCQGGLLTSGRDWIDQISYHGGLHMAVMRIHADPIVHDAIKTAGQEFEAALSKKLALYNNAVENAERFRMVPTERIIHQEII